MPKCCDNCMYSKHRTGIPNPYYFCHKKAPTCVVESEGNTAWPLVSKDDWCGEWESVEPGL